MNPNHCAYVVTNHVPRSSRPNFPHFLCTGRPARVQYRPGACEPGAGGWPAWTPSNVGHPECSGSDTDAYPRSPYDRGGWVGTGGLFAV